jgi:hypothetical protein
MKLPPPVSTEAAVSPSPFLGADESSPLVESSSLASPSQLKKRKTPSSSFVPPQGGPQVRRFSTSDALSTEKEDAIVLQARQTFHNHSAVSFRRHSTPAFLPLIPSPSSFVITSQSSSSSSSSPPLPPPFLDEDSLLRTKSHSPRPRLPRSRLSARPIEEDAPDVEVTDMRSSLEYDSAEDGGEYFSSNGESVEPSDDLEREDSFDNRPPSKETLRRLNARAPADLGLLTHDSIQKAHLISHQAAARRTSISTTFEVPSHTSSHTYQVLATSSAVPQERVVYAKHFMPPFLVSQKLSMMSPMFSHSAMSFSPASNSFSPSMSLVASFASHNFAQNRNAVPKSTFSVQDLCDLDWSGNSAASTEELFFVKECADSSEMPNNKPSNAAGHHSTPTSHTSVDDHNDFEMVV